uniref:Superoxide dismutase [Cu-Zn] 2-like n=1 Tax=Elaeis guineensis var. tenera TaxID=51953 RepID=A0A8N4EVB8_ELAGV|nr:superoxide dismutase [Cu-Zn] 2-like [Elaeis guineensis]
MPSDPASSSTGRLPPPRAPDHLLPLRAPDRPDHLLEPPTASHPLESSIASRLPEPSIASPRLPPAFLSPSRDPTKVSANISRLKQGLHGFHVHALDDTTNGCMSSGPHVNPTGKEHGAPEDEIRHAGDLENVTASEDRTVNFSIIDKQIIYCGPNSIIGRVVVVHANPDDLRKGINIG